MATSYDQIQSCYAVMQQLRPHLTKKQEFIEQVQRQLKDGIRAVHKAKPPHAQKIAVFCA